MTHALKVQSSDFQEGYQDGYDMRWDKTRSPAYKKGWKVGRARYLTGLPAGETDLEVQLPVIQPDNKYHVQVGYKQGSYKDRYVVESQIQAVRYYDCINTHSGYKKRLIGPDGALEERYIS